MQFSAAVSSALRAAEVSLATLRGFRPCTCCGYLTLELDHDICALCMWEDDGQGDVDADIVRGGPNGALSLTEARANTERYFVKYRESDPRLVYEKRLLWTKRTTADAMFAALEEKCPLLFASRISEALNQLNVVRYARDREATKAGFP